MSEKMFTFTECLIMIAYLGFLQSWRTDRSVSREKEVSEFGPPHTEKGSESIKHPDYTLEDLLTQMPETNAKNKKAKVTPFGPPRAEKGSYPLKRPDYTLKDLLDKVTEKNSHDEIDTGPPVGNEVW